MEQWPTSQANEVVHLFSNSSSSSSSLRSPASPKSTPNLPRSRSGRHHLPLTTAHLRFATADPSTLPPSLRFFAGRGWTCRRLSASALDSRGCGWICGGRGEGLGARWSSYQVRFPSLVSCSFIERGKGRGGGVEADLLRRLPPLPFHSRKLMDDARLKWDTQLARLVSAILSSSNPKICD